MCEWDQLPATQGRVAVECYSCFPGSGLDSVCWCCGQLLDSYTCFINLHNKTQLLKIEYTCHPHYISTYHSFSGPMSLRNGWRLRDGDETRRLRGLSIGTEHLNWQGSHDLGTLQILTVLREGLCFSILAYLGPLI